MKVPVVVEQATSPMTAAASTKEVEAKKPEVLSKIEPESESTMDVSSSPKGSRKRRFYNVLDMMSMRANAGSCPIPESLVNAPCFRKRERPSSAKDRRDERRDNDSHHHRGRDNDRKQHRSSKRQYNPHDTAPALEDCKPLEINEGTRWKGGQEDKNSNAYFLKQAKSILNKLSIEKFDRLSDQFIEVAVKNQVVLTECILFVVQKAQMEWHFSSMYAELCFKLAGSHMPEMEDVQDTSKLFRQLLLVHCQKVFENESKQSFDELPEEQRAEKQLLLKRQTLGHIRFIGELFQHHMLSARTMHLCIQRLFGKDALNADEESLECLCKLFGTIGQKLEAVAKTSKDDNDRKNIKLYFDVISDLSNQQELCTRSRFMLKDLIDLRRNRWVARREEAKATSLADVHKKAAQEEKQKQRRAGAPVLKHSQSYNGTYQGHANTNGKPAQKKPDGEWETIPSRPKLAKARSSSRSSSRNPPKIAAAGRPSSMRSSSRSNSVTRPAAAAPAPAMEPKAFEAKVQSILKELFVLSDVKDAVVCVNELLKDSKCDATLLVSACVNMGLEKGQAERSLIAQVLVQTYETADSLLKPEMVSKGISEVLEFLDDIEIDIPLAIPYTVQLLSPLVQARALSFAALLTNVQHLSANGKAATLLVGVLQALDDVATTELVRSFAAELTPLFAPEALQAVLLKHEIIH